jgi:UPF0755 protein
MIKKKTIKIISGIVILLVLALAIVGGIAYNKLNTRVLDAEKINKRQLPLLVYIDEKKDYNDLLFQLESTVQIRDIGFFKRLAEAMKYPENIKTGKYEINRNTTYIELVRMLRSGRQVPVQLTFNNIRLKKDFAEKIGNQLMFDSTVLLDKLNDPLVTESLGFDTTSIMTMFIPNTYEVYWNISVDKFLEKMKKEYHHFWTEERRTKAAAIHLNPVDVAILASIVEEETAKKSEYPVIAGLYLNRLRKGMLLQADPTVKFAVGDFTLRRILFQHLEINSPYNTYKNYGLPPGPIRIPSISGIDGVLNYQTHPYLYMCAKEDFSGSHNFAVTLSEHTRNAQKYQAALSRNNIR